MSAQGCGGFVTALGIRPLAFEHHLDDSALVLKRRNQIGGLVLLSIGYAGHQQCYRKVEEKRLHWIPPWSGRFNYSWIRRKDGHFPQPSSGVRSAISARIPSFSAGLRPGGQRTWSGAARHFSSY